MSQQPTPEELGKPDLRVAGFQLWVHGRQFPDSLDHDDGNWLTVTAHCGEKNASVWVSGSILMVTDLVRWGSDCLEIADGRSEVATLAPLEPELYIEIRKLDSLGHQSMRIQITPDYPTQDHRFEFEIDQTHLKEIAKQCKSIAAAYPAR